MTAPSLTSRRPALLTAMLCLGVPLAALTGVLEPFPALVLRLALVTIGVGAVVLGLRIHRPSRTRPWLLLLAGLAASFLGDVSVLAAFVGGALTTTVPLDAWLTAAAGLFLVAGVVDATAGARRSDPGGLLDAVVVALAAGTLTWSLLIVPAAAPGWVNSSVETAGSLQILLFAALIAMMARAAGRLPADQRAAAAFAVVGLACATIAFLLGAVTGSAGAGAYTGARAAFGALANLSVGMAALHPTMRFLTEQPPLRAEPLTGWRTMRLGAALFAPPAILLWSLLTDEPVSIVVLAGAWILLVPSVLLRLYLLGAAQVAAERRTAATEQRLVALVAHTGDVLLLVHPGPDGPVIAYASPATTTLFARDACELEGSQVRELILPFDRDLLDDVLETAHTRLATADVRATGPDGAPRWVQVIGDRYTGDGVEHALVVTLRDVTQRKTEEQRWVDAALRDHGTGLPNRRAVEEHLQSTLASGERDGRSVAVLMCDLDDFKLINDEHGHAVGDAALREVATRLGEAVRRCDIVGRLGGDEFVVICPLTDGLESLQKVAQRIVDDVRRPIVVGDLEVALGCSVGATIAGPGAASAAEVLHEADLALYRAKAAGKGQITWKNDLLGSDTT